MKRWLQPRRSAHFRAQKSTYSGRSSSASISRARLSGRRSSRNADDLFGRGDQADHVEVNAAAEHGVAAQLRRRDAQQFQLGEDVLVDEVVLGRIDPDQPRHRLAEDETAGGDEVLEGDQDGRLAPLLLDDAALVVDARDGGVGRAVAGQARHVAGRAVGETRPDDELLLARGIVQDARRGRHDQPDQRGRVRGIGPDALGHPVAEDAVADAVGPHPLAALVGGQAGPLQEDQARLGLERVGAPGAVLARQGLEVEGRVVAAQAEPEAVLARGSAVAGTLVAAEPSSARAGPRARIGWDAPSRRCGPG